MVNVPALCRAKKLELEARQDFNTFQLLFIPLSFNVLQALELGGRFDSELGINT